MIIECYSLSSKWEIISSFLGLPIGLIERIKADRQNDCNACWNDALKFWIRQCYRTEIFGKPSWLTLLTAINRAMVNNKLVKRLALTHQSKLYCITRIKFDGFSSLSFITTKLQFLTHII